MEEIKKESRKQRYIVHLCVAYKNEYFIVNTLNITDSDVYIGPPARVHRRLSGTLPPNEYPVHYVMDKLQLPNQEVLPKFSQRPIHISLHRFKLINTKSGDKDYLAPRGYTNLLDSNTVNDFYMFIPGNPFQHKIKPRHKKKYCHTLDLPENFDNTRQAIEYKMGIAPKNIDKNEIAIYQKLYPQGTKFSFDSFDLFISFKITESKQRGMHMVMYKHVDQSEV